MNIRSIILAFIEENPGVSAKKIAQYTIEQIKDQHAIQEDLKSTIYKELRQLRSTKQVHNNRNSWYRLTQKQIK